MADRQYGLVAGGGNGDVLRNNELSLYKFVCDVVGDVWYLFIMPSIAFCVKPGNPFKLANFEFAARQTERENQGKKTQNAKQTIVQRDWLDSRQLSLFTYTHL